jgi:transcriptional regulator with XRE-family HTH domain
LYVIGKLILYNEKLLYMPIGTKILILRKKNTLSQLELASQLDISQAALSDIESSKNKKIDFFLIHKICKIFKVPYEYFIEDDKQNNTTKVDGKSKYENNPQMINDPKLLERILEDINSKLQDIENKLDRK